MVKLLFLILSIVSLSASAWTPTQRIMFVIPTPAGSTGPAPVVSNLLRTAMEKQNLTVVSLYKSGAEGIIGANEIAEAKPDGYTLGAVARSTLEMQEHEDIRKYTANSLHKLLYIADLYYVLLSSNQAYKKSNDLLIATTLSGSTRSAHLFGEMSGLRLIYVPYKGGFDPLTDLIAGRVDLLFGSAAVGLQLAETRKLKALAITAPKRLPMLKNLPALAETYPGFEVKESYYVLIRGDTPKEILDYYSGLFKVIVKDPNLRLKIEENLNVPKLIVY